MGIYHLEISIISTAKSPFIWQNDERNLDGRLLPGDKELSLSGWSEVRSEGAEKSGLS